MTAISYVDTDSTERSASPLESDEFVSEIARRTAQVQKGIDLIAAKAGLNDISIHAKFDFTRISTSLTVTQKGDDEYEITIPGLFSLTKLDLKKQTIVAAAFKKAISSIELTPAEVKKLKFFAELIDEPDLLQNAVIFMVCHELGHIKNGDLVEKAKTREQQLEREIQADLFAAKLSGCSDGAIYYHMTAAQYFPPKPDSTHPSHLERAQYLTEL